MYTILPVQDIKTILRKKLNSAKNKNKSGSYVQAFVE